ncbi:MAG TPA: phosphatase PAP2 family protein [Chitinophagaceae bacterium]|nr:phosphatase PAP2 family protein [Chitinophagaceae bacterium]
MKKKIERLLKLISLELIAVACLFIAALFLFAWIAHEAVYENEDAFDQKIFAFLASYTSTSFLKVMEIFTFFGSILFLLPAYIILVTYFFIKKKFRYCIDIAIISLSSSGLMFALKELFHRQRPDLPLIKSIATTYSFPSGHALSSFIFCSVIIDLIWEGKLKLVWKWLFSILLLLFSFTIGISRIVLKMHYATDVIAGFCLGIAWVIISFRILKRIESKQVVLS